MLDDKYMFGHEEAMPSFRFAELYLFASIVSRKSFKTCPRIVSLLYSSDPIF